MLLSRHTQLAPGRAHAAGRTKRQAAVTALGPAARARASVAPLAQPARPRGVRCAVAAPSAPAATQGAANGAGKGPITDPSAHVLDTWRKMEAVCFDVDCECQTSILRCFK
jgi:hypothetical protein